MSSFSAITGGIDTSVTQATNRTCEQQMFQVILSRVLEFTGHTIDEVIDDDGVCYTVTGYCRLCRQVMDRCNELSRQSSNTSHGKIVI